MRRCLLCLPLILAVGVGGCTDAPKHRPAPAPATPAATSLRLVAFDSCADLAGRLRAAAEQSVGPYGFADGMSPAVLEGGARTGTALRDVAQAPTPAPAFSGTNVHEAGADEPDIVKTDGRRIVTVDQQGVLRVVDAASRRRTGTLELPVAAIGRVQLLLSGDHALVLVSSVGESRTMPPGTDFGPARPSIAQAGTPQLFLVDLVGKPSVISRYTGEGRLVDARETGGIARIVLRTTPRIPFPTLPDVTDQARRTTANRDAVKAAPAADWLPRWRVTTGRTTSSGQVGCDRVSLPPEFSGTSLLTVLTVDLTAPALGDGDPISLAADGDTVYGTPTSLYVTNDQRWRGLLPTPEAVPNRTEIFRFDTGTAGRPVFAGEGTVPGLLLNQYALSEWNGYLRVATTDVRGRSSAVRVLRVQGGRFDQVGIVSGLGPDEQIQAVRFLGDRGYVVTFRQTDPLYSLDLSDPARPRLDGELHVTGFSGHLQPVGNGRLVGIGQAADEQGRTAGAQVSLFDVSDPAAPRLLARQVVRDADSLAQFDPHALLWWPATQLLVVPMSAWDPNRGVQPTTVALRVTGSGLTRLPFQEQPGSAHPRAGESAVPEVDRSFVVGDVLWTLSTDGLQASDLSTLDRLSWLPN